MWYCGGCEKFPWGVIGTKKGVRCVWKGLCPRITCGDRRMAEVIVLLVVWKGRPPSCLRTYIFLSPLWNLVLIASVFYMWI